jgi:hypothetical protein
MIVNRNGYGSKFNILKRVDKKMIKNSFNDYGNEKMENEINFYSNILNKNTPFIKNIPDIYALNLCNHSIEMEFLDGFTPLYLSFSKYTNEEKNKIILSIVTKLQHIHNIKIFISKDEFKSDIVTETINKIKTRMKSLLPIIQKDVYVNIYYVNGLRILSIDEINRIIKKNVDEYLINQNSVYEYGIIHGDCQFNNILINEKEELKFIDPRGYYGTSRIYGLIDYDMAKICFALSGYDLFDNSSIKKLNINNNSIDIDIDILYDSYINKQSIIVKTLMCAIWLGNSHIFLDDETKCITSHFIARYMCSRYL